MNAAMKSGRIIKCSTVSFVFCVLCVLFLSLPLGSNKPVRIVKLNSTKPLQRKSRKSMRSIGGNSCLSTMKRKTKNLNLKRKNNNSRKRIMLTRSNSKSKKRIKPVNLNSKSKKRIKLTRWTKSTDSCQ